MSEQSEMEHKVSEQVEADVAWVKGNLARIESRTEADEQGRPAVHEAGYYLAKIEQDTTALKAQVATLSERVAGPAPASGHEPAKSVAAEAGAAGAAGAGQEAATAPKTAKTFVRDLVERVLSTFVQGFIGGIVITQPLDRSMWYAALAGGVGAVLALVKGLVARGWGAKNSASLLPGV